MDSDCIPGKYTGPAMCYDHFTNRKQVCGLVVTQYRPGSGSAYPFSTYILLICQTIMSACAGVYNQKLCKSQDASLHVDNMVLYASGASINLLIHIAVKSLNAEEPGFFVGYNTFAAIMVLVSNVFIGLAITAVYKCKPTLDRYIDEQSAPSMGLPRLSLIYDNI